MLSENLYFHKVDSCFANAAQVVTVSHPLNSIRLNYEQADNVVISYLYHYY